MGSTSESRAGRRALRAIATAALAVAASAAAAQETAAPPPGPADEFERQTPRQSVLGYLAAAREGDWQRAANYLHLGPVPEADRQEKGPELALHLKQVLDRTLWLDVDSLSDDPEGHRDDGLPGRRDRVGTIETASGPVDILVERVPLGGGVGIWKFSPATVARIPALHKEFGYGALAELLPPVFFRSFALEVQLWQWIGLLLVILVAYVASWFAVRGAMTLLLPVARRSRTEIDDQLLQAVVGPLRLVVALVIFSLALYSLSLSVAAHGAFTRLAKAVGVVAAAWLVLRLIDVFAEVVERRLVMRGQRGATSLVPLGRTTVKVFVVGLGGLAVMDSYGLDVTALIAGLGVGGLAVALAAQKTIENVFGGAVLIADRPVQVGDFCRFGDKLGVVEEIGMRSTRVRTLERTVVTIPNAEFSALQLENFAVRDKIWYKPRLGLRYETTPDQLRYVLVEVRKMLYAHPKVDPDPARVRFVGFGNYSLDIDIFAYVLATDYSEFLEVSEDLNLRIMDIVSASGTGFAFPSNTTYLAKDDGVDAEKTREAEETVHAWRARQELYLPSFPPEKIEELDDTLDYPPEGSPGRKSG